MEKMHVLLIWKKKIEFRLRQWNKRRDRLALGRPVSRGDSPLRDQLERIVLTTAIGNFSRLPILSAILKRYFRVRRLFISFFFVNTLVFRLRRLLSFLFIELLGTWHIIGHLFMTYRLWIFKLSIMSILSIRFGFLCFM